MLSNATMTRRSVGACGEEMVVCVSFERYGVGAIAEAEYLIQKQVEQHQAACPGPLIVGEGE